jgi:hypothetical protein
LMQKLDLAVTRWTGRDVSKIRVLEVLGFADGLR